MSRQEIVESMEGVEMTGSANDFPPFNEQEKRILEVYDKLEELQVEIALLKAQGVISSGDQPEEVTDEDIRKAENDLLESKANYSLRSKIIETVVIANPILKAVHAGSNASVIEQDLLPLIEKRDALSENLAQISNNLQSSREELIKESSENIITGRKNVELATKMIALAEEANSQGKENIQDPEVRAELDELEGAMKNSRQRWRIMKNTASAVVVGSGVDWARDPKLLEIVLDDDGD
ncbi:1ea32faf-a776-4f99-93b4-c9be746414a3 [Sclerotinia trifoliorum]|uniref:1ea32faf-a776-4f99-93b4-c9be746414a3 n=1 Tax=Sclerotinia trifoliorum TaxID=28548 RepID=A0A8H2ZUT9_9HELO|nr:1ea32faf-a776-4f99-93b4-c9be746414a3 [Sclerotinia trifoliorum]